MVSNYNFPCTKVIIFLFSSKYSMFFIIRNDYLCWYNSKETRITAMFRIEGNTKTE